MTLHWTQIAQRYTKKPVKGMLTGPVTILQWSFVRDDQPRRDTCRQIALAIRDEVMDLEQRRREDHPDRRSRLARRPADPQGRMAGLSGLGGGSVPARPPAA